MRQSEYHNNHIFNLKLKSLKEDFWNWPLSSSDFYIAYKSVFSSVFKNLNNLRYAIGCLKLITIKFLQQSTIPKLRIVIGNINKWNF